MSRGCGIFSLSLLGLFLKDISLSACWSVFGLIDFLTKQTFKRLLLLCSAAAIFDDIRSGLCMPDVFLGDFFCCLFVCGGRWWGEEGAPCLIIGWFSLLF